MQPLLMQCPLQPCIYHVHTTVHACPWRPRCTSRTLRRHASMREFISNECPLPGLDGAYREQPRVATLQAPFLAVPGGQLPCPGQRRLLTVTEQQLQALIDDQGQLVLGPVQRPGVVAAPRRGAYTCLGRVAGLQRLPSGGGLVRVVVQQRVAVQAMSVNQEPLRCTAAPLPDRWAYFVRLGALEEHAAALSQQTASSPAPDTGSVPKEVLTAWRQVQDAAQSVQQLLQDLAAAVGSVVDQPGASTGGESGRSSSMLQDVLERLEVADELEHLLEWVQEAAPAPAAAAAPQQTKEARTVSLAAAERLSYAPLAATALAAALAALSSRQGTAEQSSPTDVASSSAEVKEGLEATDLGARLELAAEVLEEVRGALSARMALAQ